MATPSTKTPITILTGFVGAGKTTLLLNTLPQLQRLNPHYTLALIKNEIGDVAVDSALGAAASLTGTRELLGDCICCTNVGQIEGALEELRERCAPDRVVIETSGSAEPAKLALEVQRLAGASAGRWELDGVVSVVDAENWGGYAGVGFTARVQARQTDLIVVNKWEGLGERAYDDFLDRIGELDVETPMVKSERGVVGVDVLFGFDRGMARGWMGDGREQAHDHSQHAHQGEVECLSVTLTSGEGDEDAVADLTALDKLLKSAPKDEVFRIKAIIYADTNPKSSDGTSAADGSVEQKGRRRYILNWSFGRWMWSQAAVEDKENRVDPVLRMSVFTARDESTKWRRRIEGGDFVKIAGGSGGTLEVSRVQ